MEVGPLARLLVSYAAGHADVKELVGQTLGKLGVPVDALFSTLGRTAARGLDAALAMIWLKEFFGELMDRVKTQRGFNVQWREVGAEELAGGCRRCGIGGGAARRSGALDQDSQRRD